MFLVHPRAGRAVLVMLLLLAPAPARARSRHGFEAGVIGTRIRFSDPYTPVPRNRAGVTLGLAIEWPLGRWLDVGLEPRWVEYGQRFELRVPFMDQVVGYDLDRTFQQLGVPVLLRLHAPSGRGPFACAGAEPRWLLSVDDHYEAIALGLNGIPLYDPMGDYRRLDFALTGGVGYELPVAGHFGRLECRWSRGLVDIGRATQLDHRNGGLEVLLGGRW